MRRNQMAKKLFGIALLWVGLATLAYASTDPASPLIAAVLGAGFISFAAGLLLFAEGFKGELLREIGK
jgi:hypothetical protein